MNPYYLIALIAISCYATLSVIAKKVLSDIPPFTFITITMIFLAIFSGISALFFEKNSIFSALSTHWLWIIGFSLINFIGFALYLYAITKMPVVEYQIIAVITPVIGGGLAYLILSEALTTRYFIGLVFIAIGLYISLKK